MRALKYLLLLSLLAAGAAIPQSQPGGGAYVPGVTQIVAGTGVTISPTSGVGVVTVNSSGGGGGLTSVGLAAPSYLTVSGSPLTSNGTITLSGTSETANTFLAAPNGSAGAMTPRAIVAADIPTLNQSTTGTAGGLTGTPSVSVTNLSYSGTFTGVANTIASGDISPGTFGGATAYTFPAAVTASKWVSNGASACTGATVNYSSTATTTGALCANAVDTLSFTSTLVSALVTFNLGSVTTGTNADFLCMASGGNVQIQSSSCTISSLRFKEHVINRQDSVLPEIGRLQVASFNMKPMEKPNADPNYGVRQTGLIAENVAAIAPECAIYENDMKTPKSYRQECVIALLVKAVQEQQREIQKLRRAKHGVG